MNTFRWLVVVAALLLPGCGFSGPPSWLAGDWVFDADATKKAMTQASPPKDGTPTFDISSMLSGMLLPQLEGMELKFSGHELYVLIHGNGTSQTFQIVSQSDTECLIKTTDGKLTTFFRAGDEIYQFPDGGSQFKIFFKRKS